MALPQKTETALVPFTDNTPPRQSSLRCFACGEIGHRQSNCPKRNRRGLLLDTAGNEVEVIYHEEITDAIEETVDLVADSGPCLMVRWVCLAPWHINENPQQHNHCSTQSELLKERFVNSLSIREVARTWWLKT